MRLFLAVFPPLAVREAAHAAAAALRTAGPAVSWVKAENLHYTMRFLGEVGEDGARRAGEAALEAAARQPAFEAALGAWGAFPSAHRARVLWVGMSAGADQLSTLARSLDRALEARGFGAPDRPFSPHLTLGRVRDPRTDWSEPLGRVAALAGAAAHFTVDRLCAVESRLSPKGSTYTVRAEAPLGG